MIFVDSSVGEMSRSEVTPSSAEGRRPGRTANSSQWRHLTTTGRLAAIRRDGGRRGEGRKDWEIGLRLDRAGERIGRVSRVCQPAVQRRCCNVDLNLTGDSTMACICNLGDFCIPTVRFLLPPPPVIPHRR